MKRNRLITLCMAAALLLGGCQAAPDEVKNNMKQYGTGGQTDEAQLEYCSVKELGKRVFPSSHSKNLTLPENVKVPEVEELGILHIKQRDDFPTRDEIQKYSKLLNFRPDQLKPEKDIDNSGDGLTYDNEKDYYINMFKNGTFILMKDMMHDPAKLKKVQQYQLLPGEFPEQTIKLQDRKVSLEEACRTAQKWLTQNMPLEGLDYEISDACILQSSKSDCVSLNAKYTYNGIPIDDSCMLVTENKDLDPVWLTSPKAVHISFSDADTPSLISRSEFLSVSSVEKQDKAITPECAVEILRRSLSGFGAVTIDSILTSYILYPDDTSDLGNGPGAAYTARPTYVFLQKKSVEPDDNEAVILNANSVLHFFFVDMITGEVKGDLLEMETMKE